MDKKLALEAVENLNRKAERTNDGAEALKFSQAALNIIHTLSNYYEMNNKEQKKVKNLDEQKKELPYKFFVTSTSSVNTTDDLKEIELLKIQPFKDITEYVWINKEFNLLKSTRSKNLDRSSIDKSIEDLASIMNWKVYYF